MKLPIAAVSPGYTLNHGGFSLQSLPLMLLLAISSQRLPGQVLFKSELFTVEADRVVQGPFEASAPSRSEISSNYESTYRAKTPKTIEVKFSINGHDNERPAGSNHRLGLSAVDGKAVSPLFVFGESDSTAASAPSSGGGDFIDKDTDVLVRLNMNHVLEEFTSKGYFTTHTGEKILDRDFKGVFIAGGTPPLSWNFSNLSDKAGLALSDPEGDGIYEVTLHFKREYSPERTGDGPRRWKLSRDVSRFPQYASPHPLMDALYNQALEEMLTNIRDDGAFMAGAMWPGVWTRDLSYSILLSLAIVNPEASKASLMAKVKNKRIIQDTGTGGSWPVSSDRVVWALAAWEVYAVTGDGEWLKQSYEIVRNSARDDLVTLRDPLTGLFRGESSFLDWREQSYPRWMDPKDIFMSENLGTNAVHFRTYRILAMMSLALGDNPEPYKKRAEEIKRGMNAHLLMRERKYYGQYLYGRAYPSLSPRSEALGEALSILFDIPDPRLQKRIIASTPVTAFGIPCIFPQIPGIPPYHNDAVWPFVEAYWAWASARAGNAESVARAMASIYRAASLFLTNKENLVASTGDFLGTEINSDRQLWSVAGNLALIYRVIFGVTFDATSLTFHPFIPKEYEGTRSLKNFRYRNAVLEIVLEGYGQTIASVTMDGRPMRGASIPSSLTGKHSIMIKMANQSPGPSSIHFVQNHYSPETPTLMIRDSMLQWRDIDRAAQYRIFRNGKEIASTTTTSFSLPMTDLYSEYQVMAVDVDGSESFLSEPAVIPGEHTIIVQAEDAHDSARTAHSGSTGTGYVMLEKQDRRNLPFAVAIRTPGVYSIDFRYANGNGRINTDDKCALRTLEIDGQRWGTVVLPQRGDQNWSDWGYSSSALVKLSRGLHRLTLSFNQSNNNMNGEINSAFLDCVRLILMK